MNNAYIGCFTPYFNIMSNMGKEEQTCWTFNNCPEKQREDCLIYKKGSGTECAFLYCPLKHCKFDRFCIKCPWFAKTSFEENIGNTKILNE